MKRLPSAFSCLVLTILLTATAAACGGDDAPEATPLPSGVTPAPTARRDAGPLEELAAKFMAGVDGKYVYAYTGPAKEIDDATLAIYRLGPLDRHDYTSSPSGFEATTITAFSGSGYFVCTSASTLKQCLPGTAEEIQSLRVFELPIMGVPPALVQHPDQLEVTELSDETFAGHTGKCFQVNSAKRITDGPPGSEEIKICFTDQGGLLYLKRVITLEARDVPEQPYSIEAQEVGAATPADFEPIVPFQ